MAGPPGFEPGTSALSGLRVKSPPLYLAELRAQLSTLYLSLWVLKAFCLFTQDILISVLCCIPLPAEHLHCLELIKYGAIWMASKKRGSSVDQKVLEHELVPKHEVVSLEEGLEVLRRYGVKPDQLPWIKASDPVAKAIGAKPGDIVKIVRKTPWGGEVIVYRYVVP